jgi:hypothetical protein
LPTIKNIGGKSKGLLLYIWGDIINQKKIELIEANMIIIKNIFNNDINNSIMEDIKCNFKLVNNKENLVFKNIYNLEKNKIEDIFKNYHFTTYSKR